MPRITTVPTSIRDYWTGIEHTGAERERRAANIERVIRTATPDESDSSLWFRVSTLAGHLKPLRA